jgi:peptide/nickel transport system substrate-binding protein
VSSNREFTRREFIKLAAVASAAVVASACQAPGTEAPAASATPESAAATATPQPAAPADTATPVPPAPAEASTAKQAPAWEAMVQAGILPPLEERLPPEPRVITPVEETGQYGGTMRVAIGNVNSLFGDPQGVMGTELILRIDEDFASVTGGLYESWEFNEDGTEQTLYLRKGMKWSDGQEMTTADSLFDYNDLQLNTERAPNGPSSAWTTGADKTPMQMEAPDDYTLKLSFADPNPLIILQQCFYAGCQMGGMFAPKHYLKQFHPAYADPAALDKMVKDGGFETWVQLISDKGRVGSTIPAQLDLPGMTSMIRTADDPDHHTYERNPYYWKVDTEGNQLPYIDKTIIYIIASRELINTRLIAGELDFAGRNAMLSDMELYQSNLDSANLKIVMWDSVYPGRVVIYPNMSAKDPDLREFFMKKNVRIALSIGIDRAEINDVVHFGLGQPRQWSMWPNSQYYREGDEAHYAEYDPDQANQLLDQEGYADKDGDGFRLTPSGKRLGWTVEIDPEQGDIPPTMEVVAQQWNDLGIEVKLKPTNRDLLNQLYDQNDLPMTTWEGDISDITWPTASRAVVPGRSNHSWTRPWALWLWNKDQVPDLEEEPPAWVKDQADAYNTFLVTVDLDKRIEIAHQMWDRFYENLPCFSTCGVPQPVVMKTNITNFPEWGQWGFSVIRSVPAHPEQFFFKS